MPASSTVLIQLLIMKLLHSILVVFLLVVSTTCDDMVEVSVLTKEKDIYDLLNLAYQHNHETRLKALADSFKFEDDWGKWSQPDYAKELAAYHKQGVLHDSTFSVYKDLKYVKALFRTLYYAKDYQTFLQVAAWARDNVNGDLFTYTFITAAFQSNHTAENMLPLLHEVNPQYYFDKRVVKELQEKWNKLDDTSKDDIIEKDEHYNEEALGGFVNEVWINANYFFEHVMRPFWLEDAEMMTPQYRDKYFFFYHQQLLARYNLERWANGLPEVEEFTLDEVTKEDFNPTIEYPGHVAAPVRKAGMTMKQCAAEAGENFEDLEKAWSKVKEFIETPRVAKGKDVYQVFAEILGVTPGQNNYFNLAKKIIGCSKVPAVIEHHNSALKDPLYWKLIAQIVKLYQDLKKKEEPYTAKDLDFPDISMSYLLIDEMFTKYVDTDSYAANALNEVDDSKFHVTPLIRQKRLELSFNYTIELNSKRQVVAIAKLFISPDNVFGNNNHHTFVEIDRFRVLLNKRENVINRSSESAEYFSTVRSNTMEYYKNINWAFEANATFLNDEWERLYWFPNHMRVPKGTKEGKKYKLFLMLMPAKMGMDIDRLMIYDGYDPNFPFDRTINHERFGQTWFENFYISSVNIKHIE